MAIIEVSQVSKCFTLHPSHPRSFQDLAVGLFRRQPRVTSELLWALKDVSFAVGAGETVGIIGSNGSGKSTCLKLLTRIIRPTAGSIRVRGRISSLLELGAGFHPDLSGRENVFLNGSLLGLRRREMVRCFDDIVAFAELERFIDVPVKFYSSGMYVRLAFAIAINVQPDVLLVDEVLAVGDQSFQDKCLERINQLRSHGVTIVLVSHSLEAVRGLCSRTIWLDKGTLCGDGLTDVVVARYLQHVRSEEEKAMASREAEHAAAMSQEQDHAGSSASTEPPQTQTEQEGAADPLGRYRGRWGSREAEVISVTFLDRDEQPQLSLTTGQPMTIAIRYRARKRIEHPMFGLAIHRSDGLQINGPNNIQADFDIPFIEGEGEVRYIVETLPLLQGTYCLTTAIYDAAGRHAYDHQAVMYPFRVYQDQIQEQYGTIYMPARWEHMDDAGKVAKDATDRCQIARVVDISRTH